MRRSSVAITLVLVGLLVTLKECGQEQDWATTQSGSGYYGGSHGFWGWSGGGSSGAAWVRFWRLLGGMRAEEGNGWND